MYLSRVLKGRVPKGKVLALELTYVVSRIWYRSNNQLWNYIWIMNSRPFLGKIKVRPGSCRFYLVCMAPLLHIVSILKNIMFSRLLELKTNLGITRLKFDMFHRHNIFPMFRFISEFWIRGVLTLLPKSRRSLGFGLNPATVCSLFAEFLPPSARLSFEYKQTSFIFGLER